MTDPFREASTTTSPIGGFSFEGTDLRQGVAGAFNPLGADVAKGLLPANTPLQGSTDSFSKWTGDAGAPTGEEAKAAEDSGHETLTNVEAAPCADCPTDADYSLAFQVKDANGKLCKGMYYTLKFKISKKEPITGSLDDNGLTVRFFTDDPTEEIYLYIGKRTKEDGYPESQTTEEEIYDEAPLGHAVVAPVAEKKLEPAKTQRLWKPWDFSKEAAEHTIKEFEKRKPYIYDDRYPKKNWDGTHTAGERLTIGAGHLLPTHKEADSYLEKYPVDGPGMSDDEMDALFQSDVENKANVKDANNDINVPLFQREFDAVLDMRFNGGSGSSDFNGGFSTTAPHNKIEKTSSVTQFLNRGRYKLAAERILTTANSAKNTKGESEWLLGVQNRRNYEKKAFLGK